MRHSGPALVLRLVAAGVAAATMAACGGFTGGTGSSSDDQPGKNASGPTTVSLMTWADPKARKLYQASLDKLTEKTGIKVDLVYAGAAAQYFQKINSMVLSNTLPDIFWCTTINATFGPLASSGKLYDWTSYVDGTAPGAAAGGLAKDSFGPGYLDFYKLNGKQYGIPNEANTYGVFYNADMFEDAGVALPSADWTWDELFEAMRKLTKKSGTKVTQYGMQTGWGNLYDPVGLSMYAITNGDEGLAAERDWIGVKEFSAEPQLVAGAKRWADAIEKGWVTDPEFTGASTWAAFSNGQVPMVWGGQWNVAAIFDAQPKMNWGFAPIPRGSTTQVAPLESNAFCSPKDIKDPDATWQVISWMLTDVFNDAYAEYAVAPIAYLPGSEGYFANLEKHGAVGAQISGTVEQELKNPEKVGTAFIDPWSGKAANLIKSMWNPMLVGKKPVDGTLDQYVGEVNSLIAGS
jgi:multiple sugar transport system substrate-binding protein